MRTEKANGRTTEVAKLAAPNILPLTYVVAVIEAYSAKGPFRVLKKGELVDVTMKDIAVTCEKGDVRPNWYVGTDVALPPKHGTNRLKLYKVVARDEGGLITSLKFNAKGN